MWGGNGLGGGRRGGTDYIDTKLLVTLKNKNTHYRCNSPLFGGTKSIGTNEVFIGLILLTVIFAAGSINATEMVLAQRYI